MLGNLHRRPHLPLVPARRKSLERRALGELARAVPHPDMQVGTRFQLEPRAPQAGPVDGRHARPGPEPFDDPARRPAVRVERAAAEIRELGAPGMGSHETGIP